MKLAANNVPVSVATGRALTEPERVNSRRRIQAYRNIRFQARRVAIAGRIRRFGGLLLN
jgi:hypothetical protein